MPAYRTGSGGVRNRRVVSTASSTATSTPANTIALTTQVVPNRSANVRDALGLEQQERRAHEEQVGVRAHRPERPADDTHGDELSEQDGQPSASQVERGKPPPRK